MKQLIVTDNAHTALAFARVLGATAYQEGYLADDQDVIVPFDESAVHHGASEPHGRKYAACSGDDLMILTEI